MYSLRHESAMRPPHVCYVIWTCDGRHDHKCCFQSTCAPALPSHFWNVLDQSACRTSPSRSAESSWARHLHNNGPFHHITNTSHQKYYYTYMDWIVRHWFILHSKILFKTIKIQLIHSTPCTTFFQIVSLTFSFFPLFENFNYHIYLKNMYIKHLFSSNTALIKLKNSLPSLRLRSSSVSNLRLCHRSFCRPPVVEIV